MFVKMKTMGVFTHDPSPEGGEVTQYNNVFVREKHATYATIYDFREIDRFVIFTPTFSFDSHETNSAGWYLSVNQRHFHGSPGKLVVKLVHVSTKSKVVIRPSAEFRGRLITSMQDVRDIFTDGMFTLEHAVTLHQKRIVPKVRGIESYSDEELLQVLYTRTMERVGDYRGPKPAPIDFSNVIDLDQIRRIKFDDSIIEKVLAA